MNRHFKWKAVALATVALLAGASASAAANVALLHAAISPQNAGLLSGLACRNLDHIVRLDLTVTWPEKSLSVEHDGYRRLVFWNDTDEFLFPKGTYIPQQGRYIVKGYFVPRAGGIHQGIASNYFEKINDARVKGKADRAENKAENGGCK